MNFLNNLLAAWDKLRGKPATATIARSQGTIQRTVSNESQRIDTAVNAELAAISSFVKGGLARIDGLLATGAVSTATAEDVAEAREFLKGAVQAL